MSSGRPQLSATFKSEPPKVDGSFLKRKVTQRLYEAQTGGIEKTEDRRVTYTVPGSGDVGSGKWGGTSPGKSKRLTHSKTYSLGSSPTSPLLNCEASDDVESRRQFVRALSEDVSGPGKTKRGGVKTGMATLQKGMAYMGMDWFKAEERRHRVSWLFFMHHLYFYCYAAYIVGLITLGTFLLWGLEPDGQFTLAQALYTSASCVSQSGLALVDWSTQSRSTYLVSFFLILGGSASLLHTVPVMLRILSFQMQVRLTRRLGEKNSPVPQISVLPSPKPPARPRSWSDPSLNRLEEDKYVPPLPTDSLARTASRAAVADDGSPATAATAAAPGPPAAQGSRFSVGGSLWRPRKHVRGSFSESLSERHRIEYKALTKVLKVMAAYWLACHAFGICVFYAYFHFGSGEIVERFRAAGYHSHWHAIYLTVSSFQNNGLVLTADSVMGFARSPILLNTIGALIVLGNTGIPIMLRILLTLWEKRAKVGSEDQRALDFLLEHPRRCFTHLFPAVHTLWLLLVLVLLNLACTLVILWQDSDGPAMEGLSWPEKFFNALFQSVSSRTAGLNSVNIAFMSQGSTFLLMVYMYLATTPVVVTMRLSSALGAGARTNLDITGRVEGIEEDVLKGDNTLRTQARRYLTQDVTYLIVVTFLICILEKDKFIASAAKKYWIRDGIYGDFSFFKVVFELASAYGTCGLSLGFENQSASFSGVWTEASQFLLVWVMILGRLRGLPDSIDPSVRVAMQQGEEAEHSFIPKRWA